MTDCHATLMNIPAISAKSHASCAQPRSFLDEIFTNVAEEMPCAISEKQFSKPLPVLEKQIFFSGDGKTPWRASFLAVYS